MPAGGMTRSTADPPGRQRPGLDLPVQPPHLLPVMGACLSAGLLGAVGQQHRVAAIEAGDERPSGLQPAVRCSSEVSDAVAAVGREGEEVVATTARSKPRMSTACCTPGERALTAGLGWWIAPHHQQSPAFSRRSRLRGRSMLARATYSPKGLAVMIPVLLSQRIARSPSMTPMGGRASSGRSEVSGSSPGQESTKSGSAPPCPARPKARPSSVTAVNLTLRCPSPPPVQSPAFWGLRRSGPATFHSLLGLTTNGDAVAGPHSGVARTLPEAASSTWKATSPPSPRPAVGSFQRPSTRVSASLPKTCALGRRLVGQQVVG